MTSSPLFLCSVASIDATTRLRPVDTDRVAALAASITEIGLQQPIIVRPGKDGSNAFVLVAGAHRLEAARSLGWDEVPAIWLDPDEATAQLIEIDENLIRNELTALDFAVSVARRKAIYEALHPETKHGGKREKAAEQDQVANVATWSRFSKDAAKRTGLSERTFQYAAGLMMRLAPEAVALLRSSPLADNGGALKKISYLQNPADQIAVARSLSLGEQKSLSGALVAVGIRSAPATIDPERATIAKWRDTLARGSSGLRQSLLFELLKHVKPGEFEALSNDLARKLPVTRQKQIARALKETLTAYGETA